MPRGNFWEMTFDPEWDGPAQEALLTDLEGSAGLTERRVIAAPGAAAIVKWRRREPEHLFQKCDFVLPVKDSYISNCTFKLCRFAGSNWNNVKFSNCVFEHCDFSNVLFERCYFIGDCIFRHNSASAELFRIEDTAISASAFLSGLETNLEHVQEARKAYQRSRFVTTKMKIARAVYTATRNEADLEYYFEAYEELIRASLRNQIEINRFEPGTEKLAPKYKYAIHSIPAHVERIVTELSGSLTNWGRSICRPTGFFLITVFVFASFYAGIERGFKGPPWGSPFVDSIVEAVNITLVAGYTAYFKANQPFLLRLLWTINLTIGLFWYSLVIPVVSKRILR